LHNGSRNIPTQLCSHRRANSALPGQDFLASTQVRLAKQDFGIATKQVALPSEVKHCLLRNKNMAKMKQKIAEVADKVLKMVHGLLWMKLLNER
jgi:hypothetical protein